MQAGGGHRMGPAEGAIAAVPAGLQLPERRQPGHVDPRGLGLAGHAGERVQAPRRAIPGEQGQRAVPGGPVFRRERLGREGVEVVRGKGQAQRPGDAPPVQARRIAVNQKPAKRRLLAGESLHGRKVGPMLGRLGQQRGADRPHLDIVDAQPKSQQRRDTAPAEPFGHRGQRHGQARERQVEVRGQGTIRHHEHGRQQHQEGSQAPVHAFIPAEQWHHQQGEAGVRQQQDFRRVEVHGLRQGKRRQAQPVVPFPAPLHEQRLHAEQQRHGEEGSQRAVPPLAEPVLIGQQHHGQPNSQLLRLIRAPEQQQRLPPRPAGHPGPERRQAEGGAHDVIEKHRLPVGFETRDMEGKQAQPAPSRRPTHPQPAQQPAQQPEIQHVQ